MNSNINSHLLSFGVVLIGFLQHRLCWADLSDTRDFYRQYVSACGFGYLCNKGLENSASFGDVPTKIGPCPPCSCDDECFTRNDCCPDVLYEDNIWTQCWSTDIFTFPGLESNMYPLIKQCPTEAVKEDHLLCSESTDFSFPPIYRYRYVPVSSNRTRFSYKNIYCALCNGENARDLEKWEILTSKEVCSKTSYLRQISFPYDMLADYRVQKLCPAWHVPKWPIKVPRCESSERMRFTRCNVTGTWQRKAYSVDVERACLSGYGPSFRLYINIFCFICNPPRTDTLLLSLCRRDIRETSAGAQIEHLCKNYESSAVTYPYKNVFCYLCNLIQLNGVLQKSFTVSEHHEFLYQGSVLYTYQNVALSHTQDLYQQIIRHSRITDAEISDYDPNSLILNGRGFNLSSVLLTKILSAPTKICNKNLLPKSVQNIVSQDCSCDPSCFFTNKCSCCVDVALSYPLGCFDNSFVVTNACYGNKTRDLPYFSTIKSLCEDFPQFDKVPVHSDGIDYQNLFCFLCNSNYDIVNNTLLTSSKYVMRGFMFRCRDVIPVSYSVSVANLFKHAQDSNCIITFDSKTPQSRACATQSFSTCDGIPTSNPDLSDICHLTSYDNFPFYAYYKNEFCYLCSREQFIENPKENCSGNNASLELEDACRDLPLSYSPNVHPYKNSFCKMCDSNCLPDCDFGFENRDLDECFGTVTAIGIIDPPSLRGIFGMPTREPDDSKPIQSHQVNETLFFDEANNIYRQISCYPGRYLNNGSCDLPSKTNKAGEYVIFAESTGKVSGDLGNGWNILNALKKIFIKELSVFQRREFYTLRVLKMFANISCVDDLPYDIWTGFRISTKIVVSPGDVIFTDISRLENKLFQIVDIIQSKSRIIFHNFYIENMTINEINIFKFMKSNIDFSMVSTNHCEYSLKNTRLSIHSPVTVLANILKCKHIQFGPEEYIMDSSGIATVLSPAVKLLPGEYVTLASNSISFCIDIYLASYNPGTFGKLSKKDEILRWVTLSTTLLSLICLFTTFIVYCTVSSLRTLPGKNLMVLVLNLFLAQFFFIMGNNMTENNLVCVVLGILQHFLWLSMLCSFTVYSFHTFKVFHTLNSRPTFTTQLFQKYLAITYLIPTIVVAVTITISFIYFGNSGYGKEVCFLSNLNFRIGVFLVPIILSVIVNLCLLLWTMGKIVSTKQIKSSNHERNNFTIFLKLFALSGGLWGLQIIDGFFNISLFSYLISILNCLQGMFIFVSVVLNKRTIQLIVSFKKQEGFGEESATNNHTEDERQQNTDSTQTTRI